jgi:hypothetical protein
VDVSAPSAPTVIGELGGFFAGGVAIADDLAYILTLSSSLDDPSLEIVDISVASSPTIIGSLDLPALPNRVAVAGGHAYLACSIGVFVVDVSTPEHPTIVGSMASQQASAVALDEDFVYSGGFDGFAVHWPQCDGYSAVDDLPGGETPRRRLALAAVPNPFNPRTEIRYELSVTSPVDLRIFDVAGRLVDVVLAGEDRPAGAHAVTWQGRDLQGRAVPSGTYIVRLEAAGATTQRKISLLR